MTAKTETPFTRTVFLALSSLAAGFLNGLLGTGGGMILIFSLSRLLSPSREKEVFVLGSVGVFSFSLISALFYGAGRSLDPVRLPTFAVAGVFGGIAGAFLLDRIGVFWLRKIFALLLLYSGLKLTGVLG